MSEEVGIYGGHQSGHTFASSTGSGNPAAAARHDGETLSRDADISPLTPYYQDALCTIYHGDCCELLPQINGYDYAVTDPPYNVGIKYGDKVDDNKADYPEWCMKWWAMLAGAKGHVMTPGIGNLAVWMPTAPRWLVAWVKSNSMRRVTIGFNCWEPVLVWGAVKTKLYRDIVEIPTVPQPEGHPVPKPLGLFTRLIDGFTEGAVIDPFAGSGTTLRAAKDLGRKSIGIEIEERYCELAAKRMSQEVLNFAGGDADFGVTDSNISSQAELLDSPNDRTERSQEAEKL